MYFPQSCHAKSWQEMQMWGLLCGCSAAIKQCSHCNWQAIAMRPSYYVFSRPMLLEHVIKCTKSKLHHSSSAAQLQFQHRAASAASFFPLTDQLLEPKGKPSVKLLAAPGDSARLKMPSMCLDHARYNGTASSTCAHSFSVDITAAASLQLPTCLNQRQRSKRLESCPAHPTARQGPNRRRALRACQICCQRCTSDLDRQRCQSGAAPVMGQNIATTAS